MSVRSPRALRSRKEAASLTEFLEHRTTEEVRLFDSCRVKLCNFKYGTIKPARSCALVILVSRIFVIIRKGILIGCNRIMPRSRCARLIEPTLCPCCLTLAHFAHILRAREEPSRPEVSVQRSILNRLAHMLRFNRLLALKVGESSTYFQNSIISASR